MIYGFIHILGGVVYGGFDREPTSHSYLKCLTHCVCVIGCLIQPIVLPLHRRCPECVVAVEIAN